MGLTRLAGAVEVDETYIGGEEPGLRGGHMRGGRLRRALPWKSDPKGLSGCPSPAISRSMGTIGELRVTLDGKLYQDTVQTRRTTQRRGTSLDHMAAGQFAWGNRVRHRVGPGHRPLDSAAR